MNPRVPTYDVSSAPTRMPIGRPSPEASNTNASRPRSCVIEVTDMVALPIGNTPRLAWYCRVSPTAKG